MMMMMYKALHLRDDLDYVSKKKKKKKKKEEEDSPALKIAWMHQYEDYVKKSEETLITTASNNSDNIRTNKTIITRKQKWKEKNNCMDISSEKLGKSQTRRTGHGYERETFRDKLNLFL